MNVRKKYGIAFILSFISLMLFLNYALNIDKNEKIHPVQVNIEHTQVRIEKQLIDVEKIKKDSLALAKFKIINVGKFPLLISKVTVDCHCTVVDWSKHPVAPHDSTFITVRYDSSQPGFFLKKVTVFSNAQNSPNLLIIRGEIIL